MRTPASHPDLTGATCVVTGGLGFIGSNLVHRLVAEGAVVRVVDSLLPVHGGDRRNLAGLDVDTLVTDIADPSVREALSGAEFVFNLAGRVSHLASMDDPQGDLSANVVAHAGFLESVRHVCPRARVVHTSTRHVYGRPGGLPVDETHPPRPVDVNGIAKLAGEQLHLVYAAAHGLAVTSLRLANVYGPRQRIDDDQHGVLSVFLRRAIEGAAITVYGDGRQTRDCVYVDDVVGALLAAAGARAHGQVLNIGGAEAHSLAEIAQLLGTLTGGACTPEFVAFPAALAAIDVGSVHTDSTLAGDLLGWRATTPLAAGLAGTLDFYREHPWYLSST